MNPAEREGGKLMWSILVDTEDGKPQLRRREGLGKVPLSEYLVGPG